jgi:hypothetical protein
MYLTKAGNMRLIVIKQFTSGTIKGLTFTDHIKVQTVNDLKWLDLVGKEIDGNGTDYVVGGVSIWDDASGDYITRKQAEWKLKGY